MKGRDKGKSGRIRNDGSAETDFQRIFNEKKEMHYSVMKQNYINNMILILLKNLFTLNISVTKIMGKYMQDKYWLFLRDKI